MQAANITSAGSGNWTVTSTWSGGVVPSANDSVFIASGHTVTIASAQSAVNLSLLGSGVLYFSTSNTTLSLSGNMSMSGTSSVTGNSSSRVILVAGDFSVASSANVAIQNIALNVGGTFVNNGTVAFTTGSSAGKSFGDFLNNGTFNNTSYNVPLSIGGDFTNNGTFNSGTGRVTFTGISSNTISGSTATTNFGGGITVNKGTDQSSILEVTSVISMASGGLTLSNGTLKLSSASSITSFSTDPNIPATARLWNNGATINSAGSFNWTLNGALRLDAGTINVGTAANNRISPTSGSTIEINGGTLNVAGRIGASQSSYTWTFLMTAGLVNLANIGNTSSSNASFMMDNSNDVFSVSGGTIAVVNGLNQAYINRSTNGSGITGGVFTLGTASTTAGSLMSIESTQTLFNLLINAPGSTVQLATSLQIADGLTLTAGNVDLNNNTLTLGLSATSPGNLVRSAGFLYGGGFRRWFTTNTIAIGDDKGLFPMGTSNGDYRPMWLGFSATLPNAGSVRVTHVASYPATYNNATHQDASWGNTLQGVSNSYWAVSLTSLAIPGQAGMIRFGGTGFGTNILSDLNASLSSTVYGTYAAATNVNTSLEVNRTGLTTGTIANNWRIGTRNKLNSPLPITFVDFAAEVKNKEVVLSWQTLTEKNSDYFTVEKSVDGIQFNTLAKVPASGNSTTLRNYNAVDVPESNNIIYYRLKQTDFNGATEYFKVIAVPFTQISDEVSVFPNPTKADVIHISKISTSISSFAITNEYGEQVFYSNGGNVSDINLKGFNPGVYYLNVLSEDKTIQKKIVVVGN